MLSLVVEGWGNLRDANNDPQPYWDRGRRTSCFIQPVPGVFGACWQRPEKRLIFHGRAKVRFGFSCVALVVHSDTCLDSEIIGDGRTKACMFAILVLSQRNGRLPPPASCVVRQVRREYVIIVCLSRPGNGSGARGFVPSTMVTYPKAWLYKTARTSHMRLHLSV
jgi:hypothetical protein